MKGQAVRYRGMGLALSGRCLFVLATSHFCSKVLKKATRRRNEHGENQAYGWISLWKGVKLKTGYGVFFSYFLWSRHTGAPHTYCNIYT